MIRKILFFTVAFIFLLATVNAAEFNITMLKDFKSEVNPGNDTLGTMVFNKNIISSNTYNLTKGIGGYNIINATVYDYITLNSTNSIMIENRLVVPYQTYQLLNPGVISFYETTTPNVTGYLVVTNLSLPVVNITSADTNIFGLVFSNNNFMVSTETPVLVYTNVSFGLLPDATYPIKVTSSTSKNVIEFVSNIKIKKLISWNITSSNLSTRLVTGASGSFGSIQINNSGNTYSTIAFSTDGELKNYVFFPKETLIYPGVNNFVNVMYNLPEGTTLGNKSLVVTAYGDSITRTFNFTTELFDNIFPQFKEIRVKDIEMNRVNDFSCSFWDNLGVVNTTGTIINTNLGTTLPVNFTQSSDGMYHALFKINNVGNHNLELCISDSSGNKNCTTKNFNVQPIDIVEYSSTLKLPRSKFAEQSNDIELYEVPRDEDIIVQVTSVTYNGTSWSVRIKDGKGEEHFLKSITEKVIIPTNGSIKISFRGESLGQYNGEIKLLVADYHVPISPITFSSEIVNYTVPAPFCKDWYGYQLCCDPDDTGDPDSSKTKCKVEFPMISGFQDSAIPLTPDQKKKQEGLIAEKINLLEDKNKIKFIIIIILSIVAVLILALMAYLIVYHPIFRFRK